MLQNKHGTTFHICKSHFPIPCMKRNNPDEIFMYSLSIADVLLIHRFHAGAFCILLIFFYLGRRSFLLYRFKKFLLLSSIYCIFVPKFYNLLKCLPFGLNTFNKYRCPSMVKIWTFVFLFLLLNSWFPIWGVL